MKKYYLISSKPDDYGACNKAIIYANKSDIKYVYYYKEIPKEDFEVLDKYLENVNDMDYVDFGYTNLKDYLGEYF